MTDGIKLLGADQVYYSNGKYIFKSQLANGDAKIWYHYPKTVLFTHLVKRGFNGTKNEDTGQNEVSDIIYEVETKNIIDDYRNLAGYPEGIQSINNRVVLITKSTVLPEPKQGDFQLLDELISRMLRANPPYDSAGKHFDGTGKDYFYGWLKESYLAISNHKQYKRGQALFFVGLKGSCKDFLQDIITFIFGNRMSNPTGYFTGKTQFNSELFEATHLKISDMPLFEERNIFTSHLKRWIAQLSVECHEKCKVPANYLPHNRVTVSLNEEDEFSLKALPLAVESIMDKFSVLKVVHPQMEDKISMEIIRKEPELMRLYTEQVPALLHYLLNDFKISEDNIDNRFGVKAYHNEEISKKNEPETKVTVLFDYIDMLPEKVWDKNGQMIVTPAHLVEIIADAELRTFKMSSQDVGYALKNASTSEQFKHRVSLHREQCRTKFWKITRHEGETLI